MKLTASLVLLTVCCHCVTLCSGHIVDNAYLSTKSPQLARSAKLLASAPQSAIPVTLQNVTLFNSQQSITSQQQAGALPDPDETSSGSAVQYAPIVNALGGRIRGLVKEVEDSESVYFYQGIRYGRAERFRKPKLVDSWNDVYNATTFRHACPQLSIAPGEKVSGHFMTDASSEDCLFLNIWRPSSEKSSRAVMVYIHGGGFMLGTVFSQSTDGRYLASLGDVVVVSISYRVNAFGFLYGGTPESPGNLGLYDQLLALRWVGDNIARFGGDPNKVTIFGSSTGSMCVGALVISPKGQGMYHRAIIQSGVPNSYLGSQDKKTAMSLTQQLALSLKCTNQTNEEMMQCLKTKSVQEILIADWQLSQDSNDTIMRPIHGDEVMPAPPVEALKFGRFNHAVDILYGVVKNEGASFAEPLIPMVTHRKADEDLSLADVRKVIEAIMRAPDQSRQLNTAEIVEYYTKNLNDPTQIELRNSIYNAYGDFHIVCPTILMAEQIEHIIKDQHRFYAYRLMQPLSIPIGFGCDLTMGVCHSTDLAYVFGLPIRFRGVVFSEDEYQLSKDMIQAWANFAKTGSPGKMGGVQWLQANEAHGSTSYTRHMSLDVNDYKMVSNHFKDTCNAFWKPRIFN